PCDGGDVVARLGWQRPAAGKKFSYPSGAGVVRGGRKPEVAELVAQFAQEFCRFRQCLHRIERVEQPALGSGTRHELGDALGVLPAARARPNSARLKSAFLPNDPRKEFKR